MPAGEKINVAKIFLLHVESKLTSVTSWHPYLCLCFLANAHEVVLQLWAVGTGRRDAFLGNVGSDFRPEITASIGRFCF